MTAERPANRGRYGRPAEGGSDRSRRGNAANRPGMARRQRTHGSAAKRKTHGSVAYPTQAVGRVYHGIVRILNPRLSLGKIFFGSGEESSILRFPDTYEDGDHAAATFVNDDPMQPLKSVRIRNTEWNYGAIIAVHENGNGSIISNYPRLRGLVFFHYNSMTAIDQPAVRSRVRFRLTKSGDGRVAAEDVEPVPETEAHWANRPIFGRMEKRSSTAQTGFVEWVSNVQETDYWYGFIKVGGEKVYFAKPVFESVYGRKAVSGDVVYFIGAEGDKGPFVRRFFKDPDAADGWYLVGDDWESFCPRASFKDFVEPCPGRIYYAFVSRDYAVRETRELRMRSTAEAIALVKDRNFPHPLKLGALDYLIAAGLERPEDCTPVRLREMKMNILSEQIRRCLRDRLYEEALALELDRSLLDYNPSRLADYRALTAPYDLEQVADLPAISNAGTDTETPPWDLSTAPPGEQTERSDETPSFDLTIEASGSDERRSPEARWVLDITPSDGVEPIDREDVIFNLQP